MKYAEYRNKKQLGMETLEERQTMLKGKKKLETGPLQTILKPFKESHLEYDSW